MEGAAGVVFYAARAGVGNTTVLRSSFSKCEAPQGVGAPAYLKESHCSLNEVITLSSLGL